MANVPALPDAERRTSYSVTAQAGPFNVGFMLFGDGTDAQNWVQVYVNGIFQDPSTWTLTSPSGSLGNVALPIVDAVVTLKTAVTGSVQIVGAQRPRRLSQFSEGVGVSAHDLNLALTNMVAELREAWDARLRSFQVPPGEAAPVLPPAASRASQNAIFDANGNLTAGLPIAGGVSVSTAMAAILGLATVSLARAQFGICETVALAQATLFDASINTIQTLAFALAGDDGGGLYKRLSGAPSPITLAHFQSVGGAWWELRPPAGIYRPEQFGAKADGVTSDSAIINAMFEYVPAGSTVVLGPKYYRISKTIGTTYGIRLRKAIRLIGSWGGELASTGALVYDNTFTSLDTPFLVQAPGSDVTPSLFSIKGLEIAGLCMVPFAASLGFVINSGFSWDPTKEYCLYGYDVIRFDARSGTNFDQAFIHDCYFFTSQGPGGGQGVGASINMQCDGVTPDQWIDCTLARISCSGRILGTNIGDSLSFHEMKLDGKGGFEITMGPGANAALFDQINYAGNGPGFHWHWGKGRFTNLNMEAHGLQVYSPNAAMIDFRCDAIPGGLTIEGGSNFDHVTMGDFTSVSGGASTPLLLMVFFNNVQYCKIGQVSVYGSAPVSGGLFQTQSNTKGMVFQGPFTRQSVTLFPTLFNDVGVGNYGIDQTGTNAQAPLSFLSSFTNVNMTFRKDADGWVHLSGAIQRVAGLLATTAVTLPTGFRPGATMVFAAATEQSGTAGQCSFQIDAAGTLSVTAFNGTPTKVFLSTAKYLEASHDALLSIT